MWSYYDLVVAQDRADRIQSAGYRLPSAASVEFHAEDVARQLRVGRKQTGGGLRTLLRRFGLVADPARAASSGPAATAQVTPLPSKSRRPAQAIDSAAKQAA